VIPKIIDRMAENMNENRKCSPTPSMSQKEDIKNRSSARVFGESA
jgi:hypothetical protein